MTRQMSNLRQSKFVKVSISLFIFGVILTPVNAQAVDSSARVSPTSIPSTPTGLRVSAGSRQVVLEWSAPSQGEVQIGDYEVEYRKLTEASWRVFNEGISDINRAVVSGLSPLDEYQFRVRAKNGLDVGEWSSIVEAVPLRSDSTWDYVYGSPGIYDYSAYVRTLALADGSVFLLGQFAGEFEGFNSGGRYKPFAQYRSSDGQIQWTIDLQPSSIGCLKDYSFPQAIVDVNGVAYFLLVSCATEPYGEDIYDFYSINSTSELHRLDKEPLYASAGISYERYYADSVLWMKFGSANLETTMRAAPNGGIRLITYGKACSINSSCSDFPILNAYDSQLSQLWSTALPDELLSRENQDGRFNVVSLAVVSDGSAWVVGTTPRPLPHMNDSITMVHIDLSGNYMATVKHYDFPCGDASTSGGPPEANISRVTTDSIWIWSCGKRTSTGPGGYLVTNVFSPQDGHWVGELSSTRFSGCIPTCNANIPQPEMLASPWDMRFSNDASVAYESRFRCNFRSGPDCIKVWAISGQGVDISWRLLRTETPNTGEVLEEVTVIGEELLVAGSLTGLQTQSLPSDRFSLSSGSTRAFIRSATVASSLTTLSPKRIMDTRSTGKIGSRTGTATSTTFNVYGKGGLPSTGISAVVLNVTVVDPKVGDEGGYLSVYPCASGQPDVSNLNFTSGTTIANTVIAPVDSAGNVCFYSYGQTHVLADVSGYFP